MKTRFQIAGLATILASSTFPAQDSKHASVPACCRSTFVHTSPLPGRSLYQAESTWTNDAGKTLRLADLRGRPQILVMFFAQCAYACPILVQDARQIESALPENIRARVGFTLVSFDTERDTPEVLAKYRARHELGPGRWTLLCGKPDNVQELAALLGVKFKKDAGGQFSHSNIITLLNSDGEIIRQQVGLSQGRDEMLKAIEQLKE